MINIEGENIVLGPLRKEDTGLHYKWSNDLLVKRALGSMHPVTYEEQLQKYTECIQDKSSVYFTIFTKDTMQPIGMSYLRDIRNRNADFGILIGEREFQGKGIGTEATKLTLDYGFTILGLHNIMLAVYAFNVAGLKAYTKAGFREIGRRREVKWVDGRYWDDIYMDCLATEFEYSILKGFYEKP